MISCDGIAGKVQVTVAQGFEDAQAAFAVCTYVEKGNFNESSRLISEDCCAIFI